MTFTFEYDDDLAKKADDAASRLTEPGAYVGQFKQAVVKVSDKKGAKGFDLSFEVPGVGVAELSLWTHSAEDKPYSDANYLNAIMYLLGVRTLKSETAVIEKYDFDLKERVDTEVETIPSLCGKPVGLVLQKELYSKTKGGTAERLLIAGVYQPETKLTVTELKEKKTTPVKLERLLKALKVKDSRKAEKEEPAQPSLGGVDGGY